MMKSYTDKKNLDNDLEKKSYAETSIKELIEQSKMIRDSIADTLTNLSVVKSDYKLVS